MSELTQKIVCNVLFFAFGFLVGRLCFLLREPTDDTK